MRDFALNRRRNDGRGQVASAERRHRVVGLPVLLAVAVAIHATELVQTARAASLTLDAATGNQMSIHFINGATATDRNEIAFGSATLDGDPITLFCVDLKKNITLPSTYAAAVTSDATLYAGAFTVPNAGAVAWLMNHFANLTLPNSDERLGLQAAIWKVEYGTDFDLNLVGTPSLAYAKYTQYVAAWSNQADPVSDVLWITPARSNGRFVQGLAGLYPNAVPEPASLLLLALGTSSLLPFTLRQRSREVGWRRNRSATIPPHVNL